MEWTQPAVDRLIELWADETISASVIAAELRTTKNSVVGKAHRLRLAPRPSPLLPPNPDRPSWRKAPKPPPAPKATLPPVPSVESNPEPEPEPVFVPPPPAPPALKPCCWPLGEPRTASFRYCDAPIFAPGQSYCLEHAKRGYVNFRQPRAA